MHRSSFICPVPPNLSLPKDHPSMLCPLIALPHPLPVTPSLSRPLTLPLPWHRQHRFIPQPCPLTAPPSSHCHTPFLSCPSLPRPLTLPLPWQRQHRFMPQPWQLWQFLTEAVWGTSSFLTWSLNSWLGWIAMFHGVGAGPFWGPSTIWPERGGEGRGGEGRGGREGGGEKSFVNISQNSYQGVLCTLYTMVQN